MRKMCFPGAHHIVPICLALCMLLFSAPRAAFAQADVTEDVMGSEAIGVRDVKALVTECGKRSATASQRAQIPFLVGDDALVDFDIPEDGWYNCDHILLLLSSDDGMFLRTADWDEQSGEYKRMDTGDLPALRSVVGEHEIETLDIDSERILLLLSSEDALFLRMIFLDDWGEYRIVDTGELPDNSFIDDYHDGHAVLLTLEDIARENDEGTIYEDYFLTFERVDDDWYLTNFTDGQSFIAELEHSSYRFGDYDDGFEAVDFTGGPALRFDGFNLEALDACVEAFRAAMQPGLLNR